MRMMSHLNCWLTAVSVAMISTKDVEVVLKPGPTVLVKENSTMDFKCKVLSTTRNDWRTTFFYDELVSTNLIGGFYNNSNECHVFSNSNPMQYSYQCNMTISKFELTVNSISSAYDGKQIKCRVQYGNGNADTDTFVWVTTEIQISEIYKLSFSPSVLYFGGNVSAILTCIANDDSIIVRWIQNLVLRAIIHLVDENGNCRFSGTADGRYQYRCDPENRRYYLIIPPSEITFNDEWRCGYFVGPSSDPVKLKIIDIPQIHTADISSCQSSNTVQLKCTLNASVDGNAQGFTWYHTYNSQHIRELSGKQDGTTYILLIPFCNYQDIGDYICTWKTDFPGLTQMNATTKLQILGPPVITNYNVTSGDTYMTITVSLYSKPYPEDPQWLFDNRSLNYGFKYSKTTVGSKVLLILYGVSVHIEGFVSTLTVLDYDESDNGIYTCIVRNSVSTTVQNIDSRVYVKSAVCEDQQCPSGLFIGIVTGSVIFCTLLNIVGHITWRYLTSRRQKSKKGKKQSNSQSRQPETYDVLGMPDIPHTYEIVTSST